jgi:hypothetical protein
MPEANAQPGLTKTERALLEQAARKPDGTLTAWIWSRTSTKARPCGKRAVSALRGLVREGLADGLQSESSSGPDGAGAGRAHTTAFTARITAAGREVLRVAAEAEVPAFGDAVGLAVGQAVRDVRREVGAVGCVAHRQPPESGESGK